MRKKILFVHEQFGKFGGAESYILEVATALKTDFDLFFCYEERTGHDEELFEDIFRSSKKLSDFQPDLIFIHKCLSIKKWEKIVTMGVPTVHMVHDHEGYCLRGSKTFPLSQKVCPYKAGFCCFFPGLAFLKNGLHWPKPCEKKKMVKLDQKCDLCLVASDYMKKTLEIQGYERIQVLFGVPKIGEMTSNFSDNNTLVYVGQINRGKGVYLLIEALKLVSVPYRLEIFGTGPDEEKCRKLAEGKNIHFNGFTSREAMEKVLSEATIGIVPSVWAEPFGKVGVEMMQYGIPVIGFDNGGISDWLHDGKNGFLVPSLDVKALAEKITLLLSDKKLAKQLGKRAKISTEDYSFNRFIHQLGQLFEELL